MKIMKLCGPLFPTRNWVNYLFVWHFVIWRMLQISLCYVRQFGLTIVNWSLCRKKIGINTLTILSENVAPRECRCSIHNSLSIRSKLRVMGFLWTQCLSHLAITQAVCFIWTSWCSGSTLSPSSVHFMLSSLTFYCSQIPSNSSWYFWLGRRLFAFVKEMEDY